MNHFIVNNKQWECTFCKSKKKKKNRFTDLLRWNLINIKIL